VEQMRGGGVTASTPDVGGLRVTGVVPKTIGCRGCRPDWLRGAGNRYRLACCSRRSSSCPPAGADMATLTGQLTHPRISISRITCCSVVDGGVSRAHHRYEGYFRALNRSRDDAASTRRVARSWSSQDRCSDGHGAASLEAQTIAG
jgi:hypothetical protein